MPECVYVGQEGIGGAIKDKSKTPPYEKRVGWGTLNSFTMSPYQPTSSFHCSRFFLTWAMN